MEKISGILPLRVERGTPVLRPRGLYSPDETYVYNEQFRDYVIVQTWVIEGQFVSLKDFYFLVRNRWDEIKDVRPDPSDSSPARRWEQTSKVEFIVAGSIVTDMLAANSVTANKIKAGSITTEKLAVGAVTADKISTDLLQADKIFSMQINVNDKFKVDTNGVMTCIDGNFSGKIQSSASGKLRFILDPGGSTTISPPTLKMLDNTNTLIRMSYDEWLPNVFLPSIRVKNYFSNTTISKCTANINPFSFAILETVEDSVIDSNLARVMAEIGPGKLMVKNLPTQISSTQSIGQVIIDASTDYNGYCLLRIKTR